MKLSDLKNAGHWPTLLAAFLYFDFSFMIWTVLGPLGAARRTARALPVFHGGDSAQNARRNCVMKKAFAKLRATSARQKKPTHSSAGGTAS